MRNRNYFGLEIKKVESIRKLDDKIESNISFITDSGAVYSGFRLGRKFTSDGIEFEYGSILYYWNNPRLEDLRDN